MSGLVGEQASDNTRSASREIGRQGALFVSMGAVIGSGWLFASFDASTLTGGSAVLAWLVAGFLMIFLAINYAELGAAFPVDGGIGRFPLFAFGRAAGFMSGWLSWIAAICIPPIETVVSLHYASNYIPWLSSNGGESIRLTAAGVFVAVSILAGFTLLNAIGIRFFRETNSAVVVFKIAVPILVALVLLGTAFHPSNFTAHGGFLSSGGTGVLQAISEGGVAFALVGFEQAVQLGGETRDPQRNIPYALLGSVLLATAIYALLQVAFTGALAADDLSGGWSNLHFAGEYGPLAGLAKAAGVGWLAYLIYAAASISPAGTGLTYTATSSRVPYAMALEGYLPSPFARLNKRRVPLLSLLVCFGVELVLLLVLQDRERLLVFATAVLALVYALAPLSLYVLRHTAPKVARPYLLPNYQILTRVAFVVANLILYWCGWETNRFLFIAVAIGVVVQGILATAHANYRHAAHEWAAAGCVLLYVSGMAVISVLGRYDGGTRSIPHNWDLVAVVVFSLVLFELIVRVGEGIHYRLPEGQRPIDHWNRVAHKHVRLDAPQGASAGGVSDMVEDTTESTAASSESSGPAEPHSDVSDQ